MGLLSSSRHGNASTPLRRRREGFAKSLSWAAPRCGRASLRAARLQARSGDVSPHDPQALCGALKERYRALGRRWDTARVGDENSALFPVQLSLHWLVVPKRARGAITDIKEASRLTSGKAWLGSRRSEIAAAAKHSQNPLCLLQLSDRYRDAPRRRAYRDAPHVSPWAES